MEGIRYCSRPGEIHICAPGEDASVNKNVNSINRTATYVIRMSGGVGGGAVRLLPIPIMRRTAYLGIRFQNLDMKTL